MQCQAICFTVTKFGDSITFLPAGFDNDLGLKRAFFRKLLATKTIALCTAVDIFSMNPTGNS